MDAQQLKEVFVYISEHMANALEKRLSEMSETADELLYESDKETWIIDWNTRKRSQVMSNKPRYLVRKIIG